LDAGDPVKGTDWYRFDYASLGT